MNRYRRPVRVRAAQAQATARFFLHEMSVQAPPVPVKKMIKKLGRLFYFHNLQDPDFINEQAFSYHDGTTYRIYINRDLPDGRDNFTYAHEIGHIVLKHHEKFELDNLTDKEYWILDREANIFAAHCLMPENLTLAVVRSPITIGEIGRLKDTFGVSWEAMVNRLDELGIQSKDKTKQLFRDRKSVV